jgi:hypothetical protein
MAGALRGEVSCGLCAHALAPRDRYCNSCGAARVPAASGTIVGSYTGMLGGVAPARGRARVLATVLDLLPILGVLAVIVWVLAEAPHGRPATGLAWSAGVVAVVYAAVSVLMLSRRGRSLGRLALGLRTVDDLTGEPVSVRRSVARLVSLPLVRRTVTADLRRGRDPLDLARPPLDPAGLRAAAPAAPVAPSRGERADRLREVPPADSVSLVFDTGERLEVATTLLVGRAPVNPDGGTHPLLPLPDLSRTVSKTHALLEWSGSVLWVTDLGSSNGTALVSPDGERQLLLPGLRGAAAAGWAVELGDRRVTVRPSTLPVNA